MENDMKSIGPDWESECKRLTVMLQDQKDKYLCEIARLTDTITARERGLEAREAQLNIYRAKMEVVELIFGK
jgi:hypothetical protein